MKIGGILDESCKDIVKTFFQRALSNHGFNLTYVNIMPECTYLHRSIFAIKHFYVLIPCCVNCDKCNQVLA